MMKDLTSIGLSVLIVIFLSVGLCFGQGVAEQNFDKGVEYGSEGKFREAKEEFENALKAPPFYFPAKFALEIIEDVIAKRIESETAIHLFKGAAHHNKGLYDKAISEYNKAIEINPRYAAAYNSRGSAYYGIGQYDRAIADFNKAIELNPQDFSSYVYRGSVHDDKGQHNQAISDYNKAIEINPRFGQAYYDRGITYIRKNQWDKAIADFSKAVEINPKDAGAYFQRGFAYSKKGQYDHAISDCSKAIEIDPKDDKAYENRGYVYMVKLRDRQKACFDWKRACELGNCRNYEIARRQGVCK